MMTKKKYVSPLFGIVIDDPNPEFPYPNSKDLGGDGTDSNTLTFSPDLTDDQIANVMAQPLDVIQQIDGDGDFVITLDEYNAYFGG